MLHYYQSLLNRISRLLVFFAIIVSLGTAALAGQIWGPVLGDLKSTSVSICWRDGEEPAEGVLFNGKRLAGTVADNYRKVSLLDLQPDTDYAYTFQAGDQQQKYTFRTAPAGPDSFTFAVYGDTRSNPVAHEKVVTGIMKLRPRFVINSGDLVADGRKPELWDEFFKVAAPLTAVTQYLPAPGNHEMNADYFLRIFPFAVGEGPVGQDAYTYSYGDVRVIVLNSTRNITAQRDWLDKFLELAKGTATWSLVVFHHPPYSSSARNGDANLRAEWVPVLEKHHVDAVFLGHDHFYERSVKDGIQYLIAGGGGAPLYAPNAKPNPYQQKAEKSYHFLEGVVKKEKNSSTLTLRMIRLDGTVGDEVVLTKKGK